MDISVIKHKARAAASALYSGFRQALKLPYARTYMALSVFLIVFFTAVTFPYEIIIRNRIQDLEKTLFRNVHVGAMDFSLFGSSHLSNVYITTRAGSDIMLKSVAVNPTLNPVAIFIRNIFRADLQAGGIRVKDDDFQADFNINGNVYLKMDSSSIPDEGKITLMVQNAIVKAGSVTLPPDFGGIKLDVPSIRFNSVIFDSDIKGADMKVSRFTMSGPDLRAQVTGNIALKSLVRNSRMDLVLSVDSGSRVLENYREFLTPYINEEGRILLAVKGTLSRPDLDIIKK